MNSALQSVLESNWIQNPITRDVIAQITKEENELLDKAVANSDISATPDQQIRCWLVRVKSLRQAKSVMESVTTKKETK